MAPLAPALHGIPTTINASSRAISNTNTRSHRDPVVWSRVANAAGSISTRPSTPTAPAPREKFPALPIVPGMKGAAQRNTPWASASTTSFNPNSASSSSSRSDNDRPALPAPSLPFSRPTFVTESFVKPRNQPKSEFPSLPTSTIESDRRARVRAALGKPAPSIIDRDDYGGFGVGAMWGTSSGGAEGYSGASTRSGSPEPQAGQASGQMQKKKKKEKVLLMSSGDGRRA